jgi:hypothetical protein
MDWQVLTKIDGKIVFDLNEIADKFCKYFTNIGINLANKIPSSSTSFRTCLGTSIMVSNTIYIYILYNFVNSFSGPSLI